MNELKYDLNEHTYFSHEAISNSKLSPLEKSGAHFLAELEKNKEPTKAQTMGRFIHTYCLENDKVDERYVLADRKLDFRKKEDKALRDEAIANDKELINSDDVYTAECMRKAILEHPAANKLLFDMAGNAEVSAFWTDETTGVECKGRFDYLTDSGYIVDLKTTLDASKPAFIKSITNFNYFRQAAMYMDAYEQCTKEPCKGFIIVAVEKDAPHAVSCYQLDKNAIEQGRRNYSKLLAKYKDCQENGFNAYDTKIQAVKLPVWALDKDLQND